MKWHKVCEGGAKPDDYKYLLLMGKNGRIVLGHYLNREFVEQGLAIDSLQWWAYASDIPKPESEGTINHYTGDAIKDLAPDGATDALNAIREEE